MTPSYRRSQDKHENRILGGVLPFVRESSPLEEKEHVEKSLRPVEKSYKRKARLQTSATDSMAKALAHSAALSQSAVSAKSAAELAKTDDYNALKGSDGKTLLSALYSLKSSFDVLQSVMIVTMQGEIENAMFSLRKRCQCGEWLAIDEAGLAFRRHSSASRLSDVDAKSRKAAMSKQKSFTSKSLLRRKLDDVGDALCNGARPFCFASPDVLDDDEADIIDAPLA